MKKLICFLTNHGFLRWLDYADEYHGFNARRSCRRCGMTGLVDSQGNLF